MLYVDGLLEVEPWNVPHGSMWVALPYVIDSGLVVSTHSRDLSGRGTARAEDAQGTHLRRVIYHQVY